MNTTQSHPRWRNKLSCHWETLWIKESEIYTQGRDAQGVIMMLLGPHNLQMNYRGMIFLYCLQHIMMRPNTVIICWAECKKASKKNLHERPWTIWESVNTCWQSGTEEQTRQWCMRQILPMMKWQLSHLHWRNKTRMDHTQTHLLHNSSAHANVCVHTQTDTHNVGPKACCLLGPLPKWGVITVQPDVEELKLCLGGCHAGFLFFWTVPGLWDVGSQ